MAICTSCRTLSCYFDAFLCHHDCMLDMQGYSHLDLDAMVQVAEGRVWATVARLPPSASAFTTAFRPWAALVQAKAMGAVLVGGVGAGAGAGAGVVGWRVQEDLRMSPPVPLPLRHVVPQAL
jgi:hypothetical protein